MSYQECTRFSGRDTPARDESRDDSEGQQPDGEEAGEQEGEPGRQPAESGRAAAPGQEPPPPSDSGDETEAVEEFDQQMGRSLPDAGDGAGEALPEGEGSGESHTTPMMEQWLQQIEGNPAYLLRNQFMMQERRMLNREGRPLRETRPW